MESSGANPSAPMRRTGGRTALNSQRIFDATMQMLIHKGYNALNFQDLAEAAGVNRTTLYRRWPERSALVLDAIQARVSTSIPIPDTGSFTGDIEAMLHQLVAFLMSPIGRAILSIAIDPEGSEEVLARRKQFWANRYAGLQPIFDRAIERGELPADVDREALLALAAGPLYFRYIVTAITPDAAWIKRFLATLFSSLPTPSPEKAASAGHFSRQGKNLDR